MPSVALSIVSSGLLATLVIVPTQAAYGVGAGLESVRAGIGTGSSRTSAGLDTTNTLLVLSLGAAAYAARAGGLTAGVADGLDDSPFEGAVEIANAYGEGYTLGLTALALSAIGRQSGNATMRRIGGDLLSSLVTAWSVTWALKVTVDARRPNGGRHSFPSGHTSTAFAAAPVFSRHLGPTLGAGAYAIATFTALARLEERKHHPWDVLVGAAIGIVAGRMAADDSTVRVGTAGKMRSLAVSFAF